MDENRLGIQRPEKPLFSAALEKLYGLKKHPILLWRESPRDSPGRILEDCLKALISSLTSHLSALKK